MSSCNALRAMMLERRAIARDDDVNCDAKQIGGTDEITRYTAAFLYSHDEHAAATRGGFPVTGRRRLPGTRQWLQQWRGRCAIWSARRGPRASRAGQRC